MIHDNPIVSISEDFFKRSEFALRISNLIKNRQDYQSIVFGINGAWGEGKTTVLNFISEDLKQDYPKIITIKFNPWRFSDESKLLESFFTTISKDLSHSLNSGERRAGMSKHERREDIKRIAEILSDYGDAISEIPFPVTNWLGKIAKVTFKKISTTELEDKKKKLSELISKYKRKIVIIIDDIDRLSKDEVYWIFRLVKLTADFNHFIYLLAYDEDMVSEAIGNRFGDGDKVAGKCFLEKIVQIPIKLPEITFHDLGLFFSKYFERILSDNKIVIDELNKKRFDQIFPSTLIFNLDSPRKVVRYSNALQFSIPMMAGEVNFVDLILLEGVKIFYPRHYEFIRDYPHYFIHDNSQKWDQQTRTQFEKHYEDISRQLSERDRKTIWEIMSELFPTLNETWKNTSYPPETYKRWTIDKRIVAKDYFTRYITYSVGHSEISDRAFELLVNSMRMSESNDIATMLNKFSKQFEIGGVIQKLRLIESKFNESESSRIARGICQTSNIFPQYDGLMGNIFSPFSQAAIFIAQLMSNVLVEEDRYNLAQDLTFKATSFEFAFEINRWIRALNDKNRLFSNEQLFRMGGRLKDRCTQESSPDLFFRKYPKQSDYIVLIWSKLDKENITAYLKKVCIEISVAISFLEAMSGETHATTFVSSDLKSTESRVHISDFNEAKYKFLTETVGTDWLFECLRQKYEVDFSTDVLLDRMYDNVQTPENLVKQFMYWHQKQQTKI